MRKWSVNYMGDMLPISDADAERLHDEYARGLSETTLFTYRFEFDDPSPIDCIIAIGPGIPVRFTRVAD